MAAVGYGPACTIWNFSDFCSHPYILSCVEITNSGRIVQRLLGAICTVAVDDHILFLKQEKSHRFLKYYNFMIGNVDNFCDEFDAVEDKEV